MTDIDEFNSGRVSVDVYQGPEWSSSFHSAEEDPFFFAVYAEVDVARGSDVVEEDGVLAAETFR